MKWTLPGTVLTGDTAEAEGLEAQFSALTLAGGIVLSQVAAISGLEPYAVQNWVKRGFLPRPEKKRYNLNQLCRILQINALRAALPMDRICGLLHYVNGALDDAGDDLIDDAALYFLFLRAAAAYEERGESPEAAADQVLSQAALAPEAQSRVRTVLVIMLTAYLASRLRARAEAAITQLPTDSERRIS